MQTWSTEKMRDILKQYGFDGLTTNTYNWLKKRVGEGSSTEVPKRERVELIKTNPTGLVVKTPDAWITAREEDPTNQIKVSSGGPDRTIKVNENDVNKYFYSDYDDTYYAGTVADAEVTGKKYGNRIITPKKVANFLNEYQDDPDVLFDPNYKNYRDKITRHQWRRLLESHPEYYSSEQYRNQIPIKAQSAYMQSSVRNAENKAAPYVLNAILGATNPLAAIASFVGAAGTDEAVRQISDGKYTGWQDWSSKTWAKSDNELLQNLMSTMTNPGAWALGTAGAFATPTYSFVGGTTAHPHIKHTDPIKFKFSTNAVKTAAKDITNLDIPSITEMKQVKADSYLPGSLDAGIGRGHGRAGGGGKGLNPRGQQLYGLKAIPRQVDGVREFEFSLPYPTGLYPVEFTLSDSPTGSSLIPHPGKGTIPQISYYNTAYDWGDPEFQEWWKQNYPGNEGKILSYKGKPIKMTLGTQMRTTNLAGNVAPGVYPSGTVTDKLVLNQPSIEYTAPIQPGYKQVGVTDVRFVDPGSLEIGNTVTLGQGGKLNYYNYIK